MELRRLVRMSDCWVGSYLQIQGVILEISKRYTKDKGYATSFYPMGYESQNSLKKKEKDLWTAKKVSSTKHSSIIHPATIHSSIIQTSSLHPPSTHHISCTRFPSRQTALRVVSGHQTLSNLKRIRVQQLQNKSSH